MAFRYASRFLMKSSSVGICMMGSPVFGSVIGICVPGLAGSSIMT